MVWPILISISLAPGSYFRLSANNAVAKRSPAARVAAFTAFIRRASRIVPLRVDAMSARRASPSRRAGEACGEVGRAGFVVRPCRPLAERKRTHRFKRRGFDLLLGDFEIAGLLGF